MDRRKRFFSARTLIAAAKVGTLAGKLEVDDSKIQLLSLELVFMCSLSRLCAEEKVNFSYPPPNSRVERGQ